MICIHIFLVIFACSLDILETSCISKIGKEAKNIYSALTMNNIFYVLLVVFMQFEYAVVKI